MSQATTSPRVIGLVTVVRMALVWMVLTHCCACIRILMAVENGYGRAPPAASAPCAPWLLLLTAPPPMRYVWWPPLCVCLGRDR